MPARDDEFRDFALGSRARLTRLADLLTGDRGRAEDLVQHALVKTYLAWRRLREGSPESYARAVIVHANIDWWRRRPWRERLFAQIPDRADNIDHAADLAQRTAVLTALAQLTARERTVVALRYYFDLSEEATAKEVGCAVGTVKSTAARALAKLRHSPHLAREVRP